MPFSSVTSRLRFARPLLAVALVAAIASCGTDNSILGIAQSWTLQSVGGQTLPFTVPNVAHDVVITSATANLRSDGNYTLTFTGTTDGAAGQVGNDHGTWTIANSTFNFVSATLNNRTFIAAFLHSTFRASVPGALVGSSTDTFDMVFGAVQ